MKAIRVGRPGGLDKLAIGSVEQRNPAADEVCVRVRASSVNYHDYLVATGVIPTAEGRIPMSDGAGEIVAVGEQVTEFAVGDAVISRFFPSWVAGDPTQSDFRTVPGDGVDGFACEFVTMPALAFTRAPAGYTMNEAATLVCAGLTAWRVLIADGPIKPGDTVLVQGTGGVSIFALQIAKAAGARVIATSSSQEKLERLKLLGADHVINYRSTEDWGKTALELTAGRGVDHVVDIGGAGTLAQSMAACRLGGHIGIVGVLAGYHGPISTHAMMRRQLRIQGVMVGSRAQQLDMIRALELHNYRPVIDSCFPLEGLADAFRRQETGRHFGKICIEI